MENRPGSAASKRAEQLRRWEESETNRESNVLKRKERAIKFTDGCVFLAACSAGDKEEVKKLLDKSADVDTCNVDGLTALHQACIDDNLDMVEFLVENGADINRGDNEGWTPLHATASCGGLISIAKFLIEHGANIAAVNNDGDLPIDITDSDDMELLLQDEINKQGINCEEARHEEEQLMLVDANQWLNGGYKEQPHLKTGALSLHVAAAKGYIKVMNLLLQANVDINAQDFDGWTALHAAAHWGQREACEMLAENLCNMDVRNYVGQTSFDVADPEIIGLMEELKKKQATLKRDKPEIQNLLAKRPAPSAPSRRRIMELEHYQRSSVTRVSGSDKSSLTSKDVEDERKQRLQTTPLPEENKVAPIAKLDQELRKTPETEVEKRLNAFNTEKNEKAAAALILTEDADVKSAPGFVPKPPLETDENNSWRRTNAKAKVIEETPKDQDKLNAERRLESDALSAAQLQRAFTFSTDTRNEEPKSPDTDSLNQPATIRRSFVPPVRDDESETQRKAHAKRVRETRRSTQGVTLEDLKSAQQYMKQQQQNKPATTTTTVTTTTTPTTTTTQPSKQFTLEDARDLSSSKPPRVPTSPEQDDNDSRNSGEGAGAAIQRRRKPKRRSTGVVQPDHVEEAEAEAERRGSKDDTRVSSTGSSRPSSTGPESGRSSRATSVCSQENGEVDYKKLYHESCGINEQLKDQLSRAKSELIEAKVQLDNALQNNNSRYTLSDTEKREKRALERKLSEMEEELRQLQKLKAENEKLKAENRALTRVVSKLTAASKINLSDLMDDEA